MEYIPFRVSTLRGDQKIDFNAYVKINEKFILYVRQGDSFEGARIQRLKEKNLKKMFLKDEDEPKYRKYLERNIEVAYDKKSGKTIQNRAEIIQGAQQSQAEEVMENPGSVNAYNETKQSAEKFAAFLLSEDEAFKSVLAIDNVDKNIAHHGVNVATISTMLGKGLGVTDPKQQQMLVLGALLHDFNHYHNGLNINRPVSQFSSEDLKIYKEHPRAGADAVKDKKHFDEIVLRIILQHEECSDGSGFPQGLRDKAIDPLALIVGVANAYDRAVSFEALPRKGAGKQLTINKVGKYPLGHLQKLAEVVAQMEL